jgi:hypothetical protein
MTILDRHETALRELDRRANDGIEVRLLWDSRTGCVLVAVKDGRSGESFELEVAPADALAAFHHPYAYAAGAAAGVAPLTQPCGQR